jgi:hypothetical protein
MIKIETTGHRIDLQLQRCAVALQPRVEPGRQVVRGVLLGEDPPVLAMADFAFRHAMEVRPDFWERWRKGPLLIILLCSWVILDRKDLERWEPLMAAHKRKYPGHRFMYMANTAAEVPFIEAAGIETMWCNHNAFVDERVFKPLPDACGGNVREFDAIYDARFARYKRHPLAAKVRRLALVHYATPGLCEPIWWVQTLWRLRHATIINRHVWRYWPLWLSPKGVAAANNRARVGLCLSAVEGPMLASIQYLLCGLPVVTTESVGGRDAFFDGDNSITVKADPDAVAEAVRLLIERKTDPWAIRERTIERMNEHRARLFEYVERFQREHGAPADRLLSIEWTRRMGNVFKDHLG